MKNKLRIWVAYLNYRLGIYKLTNRYLADYPKATRVFNTALPIAMVVGVVAGLGVLTWQIVSLAKPGEVQIVAPENSKALSGNFEAKVVFRASQDRQPFNLRFFIDGRVISAKVGSAIKKDDVRDYKFASGIGGENAFDLSLLSPGPHTFRVEARTGSEVGQGADIDADNVNFTVANVRNLATLGEPAKTFYSNQLPGVAGPRSAAAPPPGYPTKLLSSIFPKASAHSGTGYRHGNIRVVSRLDNGQPVPGVPVQVGHPVLGQCHEGNARTTDGNGVAIFTNCPVSNIGGNEATYAVHVFDTPAGYTIAGVKERTMTVHHAQTSEINFVYNISASTPAPTILTPPATASTSAPVYNYAPPDHTPLIALTGLSATSATVDAFGMQMHNNVVINYLAEVSVSVDGTKVSVASGFTPYATQSGLTLALPDLTTLVADGKPHTLTFQATNANGKSSMLAVGIAPPQNNGTGGAPAQPTNEPSSTNNPNKGSIAVSVYAHDQAGQALDKDKDARIGAVNITAANIGNNVGQCSRQNGLTANSRDPIDNFGRIHFRDCPVALSADNNHAKKYRVSMTLPQGFSADPSFNATVSATAQGNIITREVTIKKDQETEVSFLALGNNSNTIKPSQPSSSPSPGSSSNGTGGTPFPASGPNISGIMALYSDKGRYDRAMISIDTQKGPTIGGVSNTHASCGGKRLSEQPNQRIIVQLSESGPRHIRCSSSSYFVNFFKHGQSLDDRGPQNNNARVAPSITANYCTFVHRSGILRIAAINGESKCPALDEETINAAQQKLQPVLTAKYTPNPITIGRSYTYEHELKLASGEPMSPVECAGDINIIHIPLNDPGRRYPIRYNPSTKTCTFKQQVSSTYSAGLSVKTDHLKLVFDGNDYLKSAVGNVSFERKR